MEWQYSWKVKQEKKKPFSECVKELSWKSKLAHYGNGLCKKYSEIYLNEHLMYIHIAGYCYCGIRDLRGSSLYAVFLFVI